MNVGCVEGGKLQLGPIEEIHGSVCGLFWSEYTALLIEGRALFE